MAEPIDLHYRWIAPGLFVDVAGEQLHENDLPAVEGQAVRFVYVVEDREHDHREAAGQIREWLLACGAASVEVRVRPFIAPDVLARYRMATRAAIVEELPFALGDPTLLELLEEVGIAGGWLYDELLAAGATEDGARDVATAHGQMCVGRDPWAVAANVLAVWRAGRAPKPGAELAERLLTGDVSDLPPGGLRIRGERP